MLHVAAIFSLGILAFYSHCKSDKRLDSDHSVELANQLNCLDTNNLDNGLSELDQVFKSSRIIFLGEAGHGDGRTFEIKSQLVKYLATKYGFNMLALEGAGFVETPYGIQGIKTGRNINSEFDKIWLDVWSKSNQNQGLMKFATQQIKEDKLNFVGFESQPNLTEYTQHLFTFLQKLCKSCMMSIDSVVFGRYLKSISNYYFASEAHPLELSDEQILALDSLTREYIKLTNTQVKDCSLFRQYLLNIHSNLEIYIFNVQESNYSNKSVTIRDSVMASNLIWLMEQNPKAKVIVWAANFHIINDISYITNNTDSTKYRSITTMGKYLRDRFPEATYSIAFTSAAGSEALYSDTTQYELEKTALFPVDSSILEYPFKRQNCDLIFYNFRQDLNLQKKEFRSLIFGGNMHKGYWAKGFDGMIYIAKQSRSTMRNEPQ